MVREVIWTESATRDLEATIVFIATDSQRYALSIFQEVNDAAQSLKRMAERGRIVPEFGRSSIREIFIHRYRLIYRVADRSIHIVAFIHGSRDLIQSWRGSPPANS